MSVREIGVVTNLTEVQVQPNRGPMRRHLHNEECDMVRRNTTFMLFTVTTREIATLMLFDGLHTSQRPIRYVERHLSRDHEW